MSDCPTIHSNNFPLSNNQPEYFQKIAITPMSGIIVPFAKQFQSELPQPKPYPSHLDCASAVMHKQKDSATKRKKQCNFNRSR